MAKRILKNWLLAYMQYVENTEPSISYHQWCGISLISAALQRKVYLRCGFETIYPNMYVCLIGPSGKARKGTALAIASDFISYLQSVHTIADAITPEGLITDLSDSGDSFLDEHGVSHYHCSCFCLSPELNVFLKHADLTMHVNLTDWYDCRNKWVYRTKNSGCFEINSIYFSILAATAPEWIPTIFPIQAIGGGLTSRMILVVEENKRKTVADPTISEDIRQLHDDLVHDLQLINLMTGEFHFTEEAKNFYIRWYEEQDRKMQHDEYPIHDRRLHGYCERRQTHLRKLCIIISASESDNRIITLDHIQKALKLLYRVERKMPKAFGGAGTARYGERTHDFLEIVRRHGHTTRHQIMQELGYDIDLDVIQSIEHTLETARVISIRRDAANRTAEYTYNPENDFLQIEYSTTDDIIF